MSELGDWLAENVMGFQTCRTCTDPHFVDADGEWVSGYSSWDPEHVDAQAVMVLDKMAELGWDCITLSFCRCAQPAVDSWVLSLAKGSLPFVEGEGSDTRAEAICFAARAAIEAERAAARPKPHRCERMGTGAEWRVDSCYPEYWAFYNGGGGPPTGRALFCHLCGAKLGE